MSPDPTPENGWEHQADQRTHYENKDYFGQPDYAPLKRRAGTWVAIIGVIFIILLILMSSYMIP